MAENFKLCSICDRSHTSNASVVYCSECDQAFCDQCKTFHEFSNSSKSHSTIPISDHLTLTKSIPTTESYCSEHDEVYHFFCQSHNKCLCPTCLEEHANCSDTIRLSKMTKDIKTSEIFKEVQQGLTDIESNIVKMEVRLQENLSNIQSQKEAVLENISKIRKRVNDHLDSIEQRLRNDVSDLAEQCNNAIGATLETFGEKKSEVAEYQKQIDDMVRYGSELQTFLNLRNISSEITALEQFLQLMADGECLDKNILKCSFNESISNILNIETFGSVQKDKVHSNTIIKLTKNKQAQLIGERVKTVEDIKIKKVKTVEDLGTRITGCCVIPDGRMIFCDYCIIIFDADGKFQHNVSLKPHYAYDITCVDTNIVAVTSAGDNRINIVDINSKKITKYISTLYYCFGITYSDGLFFCSAGQNGIQKLNADTGTDKCIVKCSLKIDDYIESFNGKLYYTNSEKHSVNCCDIEGNAIWTFNDVSILKNPHGVSIDEHGYVYVTSQELASIFVLSSDGQKLKHILSKEDGLNDPLSIHYDKIRQHLLIANETRGTAYLFEVSV